MQCVAHAGRFLIRRCEPRGLLVGTFSRGSRLSTPDYTVPAKGVSGGVGFSTLRRLTGECAAIFETRPSGERRSKGAGLHASTSHSLMLSCASVQPKAA